jgi:hypothetical protein
MVTVEPNHPFFWDLLGIFAQEATQRFGIELRFFGGSTLKFTLEAVRIVLMFLSFSSYSSCLVINPELLAGKPSNVGW